MKVVELEAKVDKLKLKVAKAKEVGIIEFKQMPISSCSTLLQPNSLPKRG